MAGDDEAREQQRALAKLGSFVDGLYVEMDKLAKKAPSSEISDLAFDRVSRAITNAKKLLDAHDEFVSEIKPFVQAGSNPEVRDVLLVLREITTGIERRKDDLYRQRQAEIYGEGVEDDEEY